MVIRGSEVLFLVLVSPWLFKTRFLWVALAIQNSQSTGPESYGPRWPPRGNSKVRRVEGEPEEREGTAGREGHGLWRVPFHHWEHYCIHFRLTAALQMSQKHILSDPHNVFSKRKTNKQAKIKTSTKTTYLCWLWGGLHWNRLSCLLWKVDLSWLFPHGTILYLSRMCPLQSWPSLPLAPFSYCCLEAWIHFASLFQVCGLWPL